MRIQVKGRNVQVSDDVRDHVEKRFRKIAKQVSELAELELELFEERNPAISDRQVAEATLHLKGVTLRARDASGDLVHSINLCADELSVQVKRHRDKRRKRRESRVAANGLLPGSAEPVGSEVLTGDISPAGGEVLPGDVSPAA
jgi:putative sigma-54 modulation protein